VLLILYAPDEKQQQTFFIILPNLIHKSKKRNLTWQIARRLRRWAEPNPSARGQKISSP